MFNTKRILALAAAAASAGLLIITPATAAFAAEEEEELSIEELIRQKREEQEAALAELGDDYVELSSYDYTELDPEFARIATIFGDVNYDHLIGIADAVQLQRYLLGQIDDLGNWFNADLNHDGVVNAGDFTLLKQQIAGATNPIGGSAVINLIDVMTSEPIEGGFMRLFCVYDNTWAYDIGQWKNKAGNSIYFSGLPNDPKYVYYIEVNNLPIGSNYGNLIGNCSQQFNFSFGEGETSKAISVRLASHEAESNPNVALSQIDWSMEKNILDKGYNYGWITILDMEGNMYYQRVDGKGCALPDGEYRAVLHPYSDIWSDYDMVPVDPDSDFANHIRELHPDVVFADKSAGIEFTVQNGQADKEISFDFGPKPGLSDSLRINCIDGRTGEPLEGVEITLIEAPDTYAKTVGTWTSDATGTHTFTDLFHTGYDPDNRAYRVCVGSMPAGYETGSDSDQYLFSSRVSGDTREYTFDFYEIDTPKGVSADIVKYGDGTVLNSLSAYDVYRFDPDDPRNLTKVYSNVQAGEAFALRDGQYIAWLNSAALPSLGYDGINLFDAPADILEAFDANEFYGSSIAIRFTVTDGTPDRALKFYVTDYAEN